MEARKELAVKCFGRFLTATIALSLTIPASVQTAQQADTMRVPVFGSVTIYRGLTPPQQVVLFISGDGGWNLGVVGMAERLRDNGALVVGIDIRAFMKSRAIRRGPRWCTPHSPPRRLRRSLVRSVSAFVLTLRFRNRYATCAD